MADQAVLRVYGEGNLEVELTVAYLTDLRHAYNSVVLFESVIDGMLRAAPYTPPGLRFALALYLGWPAPRRRTPRSQGWPMTAGQVASYVPHSEQLILSAVSIASPGSWDFLGTINPLEVIRQYLNDRHERQKDRDYRTSAEADRLRLENMARETEVISGRVKLARELGATDRDLAPLLNELIYKPLPT